MLKKLPKLLLSLTVALAAGLPVLASDTGFTINADIDPVVSLQVETSSNVVVSPDDMDTDATISNSILDFGTIDPMAINTGSFTATNGTPVQALNRQLIVTGNFRDETSYTGVMAPTDGAVYFIEDGYQLRAFRNDGVTDMDVDVEVTGATALDSVIDVAGINNFTTAGSSIGANSRRVVGGAPTALFTNMSLNAANSIDIGVIVPLNQPAGPTSTDITFYGT